MILLQILANPLVLCSVLIAHEKDADYQPNKVTLKVANDIKPNKGGRALIRLRIVQSDQTVETDAHVC